MNIFFLKLTGLTASYRLPDTKNFHKTCDFPTKSSIIGIIGAAIATSISMALWNISAVIYTKIKLNIWACYNPFYRRGKHE